MVACPMWPICLMLEHGPLHTELWQSSHHTQTLQYLSPSFILIEPWQSHHLLSSFSRSVAEHHLHHEHQTNSPFPATSSTFMSKAPLISCVHTNPGQPPPPNFSSRLHDPHCCSHQTIDNTHAFFHLGRCSSSRCASFNSSFEGWCLP